MTYQYVKPTEEQVKLMQAFRDEFETLEGNIQNAVPSSEGLCRCVTKLREASFWLNAAITKND